ncbi:unnamed protein product [Musa textilis]
MQIVHMAVICHIFFRVSQEINLCSHFSTSQCRLSIWQSSASLHRTQKARKKRMQCLVNHTFNPFCLF